ncbi:MAG TPA: RimK/LysX family protein [Oligoflexia bacterium]|nr:RimK/LysX family protein [Oligoflexia bacterium]HMR24062.1 RimK/LysX family protein [Oligoflexia bacterium]
MKKSNLSIIGWREWIALPDLKVRKIKAKIDSGARTSSLHAHKLKVLKKNNEEYAQFYIYPQQDSSKEKVLCEEKILEYRKIKSSNGITEKRPIIQTYIKINEKLWLVDLSLSNRDEMGFRILLGRTSISKKFLIDVSKSFLMMKET